MLQELSHAKAQEAPSFMRFHVALMWERQWTRMLSVTCATAFAASLVEPARHLSWCLTGGKTPLLADLFESDPRSFCPHATCELMHFRSLIAKNMRRRIMPRRGWLPAPDGWVQILGPRPPGEMARGVSGAVDQHSASREMSKVLPALRCEDDDHQHESLQRCQSKPHKDVSPNSKVLCERSEMPQGLR